MPIAHEEKEKVIKDSKEAIHFLKKIYDDFDALNYCLSELSEMLDSEEYQWFHNFWSTFPNYMQLDELDQFLTDLVRENEEKNEA